MCCMCPAGHDEDEEKAKIGTPLERMFLMAEAMLEAMKMFKSPDGKSLRIRVGMIILLILCLGCDPWTVSFFEKTLETA